MNQSSESGISSGDVIRRCNSKYLLAALYIELIDKEIIN